METKDISNIILKIAGMILVIISLLRFPDYISYYTEQPEKSLILFISSVLIPNGFPLIIGIIFFRKPGTITNKILVKNSDEDEKINYIKLEQIILTALGVYIVFNTISLFSYEISQLVEVIRLSRNKYGSSFDPTHIFTRNIVTGILELLFAFWLIFKSEGLVKIFNNFRNAGN